MQVWYRDSNERWSWYDGWRDVLWSCPIPWSGNDSRYDTLGRGIHPCIWWECVVSSRSGVWDDSRWTWLLTKWSQRNQWNESSRIQSGLVTPARVTWVASYVSLHSISCTWRPESKLFSKLPNLCPYVSIPSQPLLSQLLPYKSSLLSFSK